MAWDKGKTCHHFYLVYIWIIYKILWHNTTWEALVVWVKNCQILLIYTWNYLLYCIADDTILFSDCPKDFQLQLDIFCDYCHQFKLKVNISKTKCMTFSKGRNSNNQIFKFDGENIENVNQYNYLGIVFTRTCTFTEAKNNNVRKATVAMYDVFKKRKNV